MELCFPHKIIKIHVNHVLVTTGVAVGYTIIFSLEAKGREENTIVHPKFNMKWCPIGHGLDCLECTDMRQYDMVELRLHLIRVQSTEVNLLIVCQIQISSDKLENLVPCHLCHDCAIL